MAGNRPKRRRPRQSPGVLWIACATLAALPSFADEPQIIFAGREQQVRVTLPDKGGERALRILQATSATLVPVGGTTSAPVSRMIVEALPVTVPDVRAPTRFVIDAGGVRTQVLAVPQDTLKGLARLTAEDERPLGIFDPDAQLRPALKNAGVEFADFEIEPRDCRLMIAWTKDAVLPESVTNRVTTGTPLVWFRPQTLPLVLATRWESGRVVVVPPAPIDSAAMQHNLVRYAELALTPEAWRAAKESKE